MPSVSKVILNGTTLMDVTDKTVDEGNLLYGETATKNDGTSVTGAVVTAPASTADPAMDGTASPGSANTYSRGDHVHPSDTSKQAKITASGMLKGDGQGGVSAAVAGTDYQAPITNPITGTGQNKYLAKFNGTNSITSGPELIAAGDGKYLAHDGLWADPLPSRTGNSGKFLTTNGTAVSWANVSGVEYFVIMDDIDWVLYPASTFVSCYNSGKMPIVVYDGVHCYPRIIDAEYCVFNGISYTTTSSGNSGFELVAFVTPDENQINPWVIGGGGGSEVSYTAELSSGTKVGTITIDGTDNDIYAPTNTDVNVTQTKGAYSSYTNWRGVALGGSSVSSAVSALSTTTGVEYTFDNLKFQPSTGTLRTRIFNVAPTTAGTTASNNQMSSDATTNIYFRVNNGVDTVMTLYSNGTDMQVRPGGSYDNQVDLGKSTVRWKDAYLSGTVNAADYAGDITATTTVASGDKIIVHDTSASNVAGGITLGNSTTQYLANDGSWQNMPVVPTGSSTSPAMDGTATVGTETTWAHGDHIHPTDTTRQAKITASGILKGDGSGGVTAAVAGTDYAEASHDHAASDITSGTLGVARGGTGASTLTSGEALIGNGANAITTRTITNNTTSTALATNTNIPTMNTVKYGLDHRLNRDTAVNVADDNYTTFMARGEALYDSESYPGRNGVILWVYE